MYNLHSLLYEICNTFCPYLSSSLDADESSESSDDNDEDVVRGKKFQAVTCTGRQPGSSIFVFGPTLHINEHGELIPIEQQEYIWVPRILQQLHRVINPLTVLPDSGAANPMRYVVQGLQNIAGDNVISGVILLGKLTLVVELKHEYLNLSMCTV